MKEIIAWLTVLIIAAGLLVVGFGSWTTVNTGHVGIELSMGRVTGRVLPEGFSFKMPLLVSVQELEVRIQKEQVSTTCASKDLQLVTIKAALNYNLEPDKADDIYKSVGRDFVSRIIDPSMQEAIKSITAKYTAEELITKREAIRGEIKVLMAEKLTPYGLHVDEFNIVDFDFSKSFNESIEAKVTAEQNALAAKNKLAQIEYEAEQKVAEAKGKAEAMRVESEALNNNPAVLQLRALEKWDGVLPKVTSGAVPFINMTDIAATPKK